MLLVVLYAGAGVNHLWHPDGYVRIIPAYLPFHTLLNYLAGVAEISLALLLIFKATRKAAAWLIVLMLAAFLPVHIDMLVHAPIQLGKLRVTPALAWARLLLQPVLMLWAWWHTRK